MKKPVVDSAQKKIKEIEFGIFSEQEAKKLSVLELHERNIYDVSGPKRIPAKFGVLDRRLVTQCYNIMGPTKGDLCDTCNEPIKICVGHFGVVRLVLPVFHVGYFKHMLTLLQNICKTCSKVLLEEPQRRSYLKKIRSPNIDGVQRKDILKNLNVACKKVSVCPHCKAINGTVKKVGALKLIHEKFKKKKKTEEEIKFNNSFENAVKLDPALKPHVGKAQEDLNPLLVLNLFECISNEDCELMGLDSVNGRPELFLWKALPVPPVSIRPSVGLDTSSTEDDLTVLMSEIVECNTKMKMFVKDGTMTSSLMDHWEYLQLQTAMYITSDLPGIPMHLQANLRKIKKGLCQRMKGKHGRFRGNLSGKRVDFSGRTVISPDPNLRIDQVAVPMRVAKVLTYPEKVTDHNIERLRQNVINGPEIHPGAVYIERLDGNKKFLKYAKRQQESLTLKIGDTVFRHLHDNDVVLFNRQPSLHKLSIMSHFAKVRPWRTFRFNECVCTPYNADFDGDEMNMHLPQTEEARAEAMQLMGTKNNLVTPRNGEPLIAATQDFITCCYLLSRKDVFYDRSQFSQICCYMFDAEFNLDLPAPTILKPMRLWTGKQVFNVLMKPNLKDNTLINLETNCRTFEKPKGNFKNTIIPIDDSFCANDGFIVIYNSEIMCGVVDKAIIGDGTKKGMFYVALRDYGPVKAAEFMNSIQTVRVAKLSARWMGNQGFSIGIDDVQASLSLIQFKDDAIEKGYTTCDDLISKAALGDLQPSPGSTVEETLESSISGVLSKIREELGNRCMKALNKYNAPKIMSLCGSKGSKINVSQMVAVVGQQIISGSRVPDGFGDRSLPHFPKYCNNNFYKDVVKAKTPAAKGFVKNSFYTGLSPTEFLFHAISGREGLVDTAVKTAETGYMQRRLTKAFEDLYVHYDRSVRNSNGGLIQRVYGDDGLDPACIEGALQPVEFFRNLKHCQAIIPSTGKKGLKTSKIIEICENEIKKWLDKKRSLSLKISKEFCESLLKFIKVNVCDNIDAINLFREKIDVGVEKFKTDLKLKLTKEQLEKFLSICYNKYAKSVIEPGTGVGAIGAQSIGEPGTQMTLKTFHFAGVASMNVTLGVPRIKEIINAAKKISTPIIDAPLDKRFVDSLEENGTNTRLFRLAKLVKGRVEKTLLADVVDYIQEFVTGKECLIKIKLDVKAINELKLEISLDTIKYSILTCKKIKKLKILPELVMFDGNDGLKISVEPAKNSIASESPFYIMQALKSHLPKVIIKGIPTVNRSVISGEGENVKLLIEGMGLKEVMNIDGIDGIRAKTNHTLELHKVLGVEAARESIISEIIHTMESHGMTIDRRHVMLMADLMSFKGEILGITRFGIAKMKDSVLMLASFEKTTDHLFDASFFSKKDPVHGVSECIILGIPMSIGTGLIKVVQKLAQHLDDIPKPKEVFSV
ncbi:hypothetical protein HDU92_008981 [Lobulomyces angularis]|nr:hypothetical protein HDU92_008981 [Lobulomyces angularis]